MVVIITVVLRFVILVVVTILTIVSVVGRTGFDVPILGDSEIVEVGVAYSVFSFLAYCQMRGANVIVDFFTARAPAVVRNGLDAVSNAVFAVVVCSAMDFLTTSAIYCFCDLGFVFAFLLVNGRSPLRSSFDASADGYNGSLLTFAIVFPLT